MVNDIIGDCLTRIRNAHKARHDEVEVLYAKIVQQLVEILKREGYLRGYELVSGGAKKGIRIALKYGHRKKRVFAGLTRVSKPGRRVYVNKDEIPKVLGGLGVAVLSTSRGVVTDKEARELGVGGEFLCQVW